MATVSTSYSNITTVMALTAATSNLSSVTPSIEEPNDTPGLTIYEIIGGAFLCCLALITLAGNGITIQCYFLFLRRRRGSSSIKLIANMAAADLSMGIILPYVIVLNYAPELKSIKYVCVMRHVLILFAVNVSVIAFALVTLDRFVYFIKPIHYPSIVTRYKTNWAICISWLYIGAITFLPLLVNNWKLEHRCGIMQDIHGGYIIAMLLHSVVIAIFILAGNLKMLRSLLSFSQRYSARIMQQNRIVCRTDTITDDQEDSKTRKKKKKKDLHTTKSIQKQRKIIKFIVIVLGFFFICWLPFFVVTFFQAAGVFSKNVDSPMEMVKSVLFFIGVINSACNPIIYHARHQDYRDALEKLVKLWRKKICGERCCKQQEDVDGKAKAIAHKRRSTISTIRTNETDLVHCDSIDEEDSDCPLPEKSPSQMNEDVIAKVQPSFRCFVLEVPVFPSESSPYSP